MVSLSFRTTLPTYVLKPETWPTENLKMQKQKTWRMLEWIAFTMESKQKTRTMAKIKVKFKYVTIRGESRCKTVSYDCPDFESITTDISDIIPELKGHDLSTHTTSVESQQMEWLDNQDKEEFMDRHEAMMIVDYWVVKPRVKAKSKPETTAVEILKQHTDNLSDQMLIDFVVVHEELSRNMDGISKEQQVRITMNAMGIAYKASAESYKSMTRYSKELTAESLPERRERKRYRKAMEDQKSKHTGGGDLDYDGNEIQKPKK